MPHSSGGGSHSGGCHSGGCHGGSSGGSHGRSGPRMSNNYYPGARRFRYHDRDGIEKYIYGDEVPQKMSKAQFIGLLIFMIPFLVSGIMPMTPNFLMMREPTRINPHYQIPDSYVVDSCDVIDNEDALNATLNDFRELTGICPYVVTVKDSTWNSTYSTLEDAAYDYYVENFDDEEHFLILYSVPDDVAPGDYVDWSWEGMQGDYTDSIITSAHFSEFQHDFHTQLVQDVPVGDALQTTFTNSLNYMMDKPKASINALVPLLFSMVWYTFVFFFIFLIVKSYKNSQRDYEEVPLDNYFDNATNVMNRENRATLNDVYSLNGLKDPYANRRGKDDMK